ncbi:MAG: 3-oxo-5-alpha-steroid 4-dehydrogenase [Myxococcales bacterium]|nr:3-oxo-5-alpha-steroid 4-dehydrogenase [Myxococcales bacterium]
MLIGFAVYSFAFHGGWIALVGQGVTFASIWKITGIPATEAQALRSKGDRYREYQQTMSTFLPLPRKKRRTPSDVTTIDTSGPAA